MFLKVSYRKVDYLPAPHLVYVLSLAQYQGYHREEQFQLHPLKQKSCSFLHQVFIAFLLLRWCLLHEDVDLLVLTTFQ
jgi:hypothetical protein